MESRFNVVIAAGMLCSVLMGCPEDTVSTTDTAENPYADVTITQTECDYDAECASILGTLDACRVARCEAGACIAAIAPAGVSCEGAQGLDECEAGVCNEAGNCVGSVAPDGTSCDVANWTLCTGRTCQGGVCTDASLVSCDDKNPCTADVCDDATGDCTYQAVDDPCDDNNPCTGGDACTDGVCIGTENLCQCDVDSDCVDYDDGDLCNGIFFCDNGICAPKAGSEVTCTPEDTLGACEVFECNPANGKCELGNAPQYTACDDGDVCTGCAADDPNCAQGDYCQDGACKAGLGKPCTCTVNDDCLPYEDGDACNGTLACGNDGICALDSATVVDCSTAAAPTCSEATCNPSTGVCDVLEQVADGTSCDDGDVCTTGETCTAGACGGGTDNVACQCVNPEDCAALDDGDLCNGGFTCNNGTCEPDGNVVDCTGQTQDQCTALACNPTSGVCDVPTPLTETTGCDDGNPCTIDDVCTAGGCAGSGSDTVAGDSCDDSDNTTNTDICDAAGACAGTPYTCTPTTCQETSVPNGTDCDVTLKAENDPCDDADDTTANDICDDQGACAGTPIDCSTEPVSTCTPSYTTDGTGCVAVYAPAGTDCPEGLAEPECTPSACDGTGVCATSGAVTDGTPCGPAGAGGQCTSGACVIPPLPLFFSEYVEGGGNNKALEIYNAGTSAVDLAQCEIRRYDNNSTAIQSTYAMTGSLDPGAVVVIANSGFSNPAAEWTTTGSQVFQFNGDDPMVLACNGVEIDLIGEVVDADTGPWAAGDGAEDTENNTLRRKCGVTQGSMVGTASLLTEWDTFAQDTVDGLGTHTAVCP